MKKVLYLIVLLMMAFSCNTHDEPERASEEKPLFQKEKIFEENNTFDIIIGPCGTIKYCDRIGNDYKSALDSLLKIRKPNLIEEYYLDEKSITVKFNVDDRSFTSIAFRRVKNDHYLFSITDVLDGKGNYYIIFWCED